MNVFRILIFVGLSILGVSCATAQSLEFKITSARLSTYDKEKLFLTIKLSNSANKIITLNGSIIDSIKNDDVPILLSEKRVFPDRYNGYILFGDFSFDLIGEVSPFVVYDGREGNEENKFLSRNSKILHHITDSIQGYQIYPKANIYLNVVLDIDRLELSAIPVLTQKQKKKLSAELALRINYLLDAERKDEWLKSGKSEKLKNALITW